MVCSVLARGLLPDGIHRISGTLPSDRGPSSAFHRSERGLSSIEPHQWAMNSEGVSPTRGRMGMTNKTKQAAESGRRPRRVTAEALERRVMFAGDAPAVLFTAV